MLIFPVLGKMTHICWIYGIRRRTDGRRAYIEIIIYWMRLVWQCARVIFPCPHCPRKGSPLSWHLASRQPGSRRNYDNCIVGAVVYAASIKSWSWFWNLFWKSSCHSCSTCRLNHHLIASAMGQRYSVFDVPPIWVLLSLFFAVRNDCKHHRKSVSCRTFGLDLVWLKCVLVDHVMSYIFRKLGPTAFRFWFPKCIFCISVFFWGVPSL